MLRTGALLALGGAVAPLAGCDPFDRDGDPAPGPDPLARMAEETFALATTYRTVAASHPALAERLTPIGDAHVAHAEELARVARVALPSTAAVTAPEAPPEEAAAALTALRAQETTARDTATRACLEAPAHRAALLASIAAARATHLEALR